MFDSTVVVVWPYIIEDIGGVFIYCAIATFIILKVIDMIVGLRVSKEVEVEGLDINLHGETVHG